MGHSIYLADDEKSIRELLHSFLASDGYTVRSFESGDALLEAFRQEPAELVILDIMMPGTDGLTVCRELRALSDIPIILLTAKDSELDYVMGISQGSDDYLTKPFRPTILLMKVKALLRRYCIYQGKAPAEPHHPKPDDQMLELHGVRIALDCNRVWVDEQEADLTETEYKILKLLMQSPQRIFPVQVIYETVWGEPYFYVSNGTVMVHIRNLRMKVEHNPQNPQRICTIWGKGYRFAAQEDDNGNA